MNRLSPDSRVYLIKNGNYIGQTAQYTVINNNITGLSYLSGVGSGIFSMANYATAVRSGKWPVEPSTTLETHFDFGESLCYPGTGTSVTDVSGNGNTGTTSNSPTYTTVYGGEFNFVNTSSQSIRVNSNADLSFGTADFSIETWLYLNRNQSVNGFFQNDAIGSSTSDKWYLAYTTNNLYIGRHNTANAVATAFTILLFKWYHVIVTRTSGTTAIYVNGQSQSVSNATVFNGVSFGQNGLALGGISTPYYLNGSLGALRLYKRSLTANEALWNYRLTQGRFLNNWDILRNSLSVALDPGDPKSYSGSGSTWLDTSGNNYSGTITGATYSSSQGGYFTFNGTTDNVDFGALAGSFTSFTVIVWFYPTSIANYRNVIDCNNGVGENMGPRLEMSTSNNLYWTYSGSSNPSNYYFHAVMNSGLAINTWYCAAITYNSVTSNSTTYINGVPSGINRIVNGSPGTYVNSMGGLKVGRGYTTADRYFAGRISAVQIYNRSFTDSEIVNNYQVYRDRYGI